MNPLKLKINLLSKKDLEEKALGRFLKWSLSFGRYIIVGTEIIVLIAFFSRFKLDRQLTDLHEAINQKGVLKYRVIRLFGAKSGREAGKRFSAASPHAVL